MRRRNVVILVVAIVAVVVLVPPVTVWGERQADTQRAVDFTVDVLTPDAETVSLFQIQRAPAYALTDLSYFDCISDFWTNVIDLGKHSMPYPWLEIEVYINDMEDDVQMYHDKVPLAFGEPYKYNGSVTADVGDTVKIKAVLATGPYFIVGDPQVRELTFVVEA